MKTFVSGIREFDVHNLEMIVLMGSELAEGLGKKGDLRESQAQDWQMSS